MKEMHFDCVSSGYRKLLISTAYNRLVCCEHLGKADMDGPELVDPRKLTSLSDIKVAYDKLCEEEVSTVIVFMNLYVLNWTVHIAVSSLYMWYVTAQD